MIELCPLARVQEFVRFLAEPRGKSFAEMEQEFFRSARRCAWRAGW